MSYLIGTRRALLSGNRSILDDAVFATRAYGSNGVLTDLSGRGHAIQHGSAAGADSNDPRYLAYAGAVYGFLPGSSGNYFSCPDSAAVSITGDLDLRVQCALDDWTPGSNTTLIGKRNTSGNQCSFLFKVNTAGTLGFQYSPDGTSAAEAAATSSVATGITDGATKWVRGTYASATGKVNFYLSDDGSSWSLLGTEQTITAAAIFDSTAAVEVGSTSLGTSLFATGKFYRAQVYNGIGGTLVADFNPTLAVEPFTSFADGLGNTWTVNRSSSGRMAAIVRTDRYSFGTDDGVTTPDSDDLDVAADGSFTLTNVFTIHKAPGATQMVSGKKAVPGNSTAGYSISLDTSRRPVGVIADGTNTVSVQGTSLSLGVEHVVSLVRDVPNDQIYLVVDGVRVTPVADTTTATLANSGAFTIGCRADMAGSFWDGEGVGVAFAKRVVADAECARVGLALQGVAGY